LGEGRALKQPDFAATLLRVPLYPLVMPLFCIFIICLFPNISRCLGFSVGYGLGNFFFQFSLFSLDFYFVYVNEAKRDCKYEKTDG
jgi:hypothetical protein